MRSTSPLLLNQYLPRILGITEVGINLQGSLKLLLGKRALVKLLVSQAEMVVEDRIRTCRVQLNCWNRAAM